MRTFVGEVRLSMPTSQKSVRKVSKTKSTRKANSRERSRNGKQAAARSNPGALVAQEPAPVLSQREQLEQERRHVEAELLRLRAELQEAPEPTGDEIDLNVYEREKTLGLVAAYERRLDELDHALRAAEKGKYGICVRCGKPIDPERLKIFPEATMDVNCKNEVEQLARRGKL